MFPRDLRSVEEMAILDVQEPPGSQETDETGLSPRWTVALLQNLLLRYYATPQAQYI